MLFVMRSLRFEQSFVFVIGLEQGPSDMFYWKNSIPMRNISGGHRHEKVLRYLSSLHMFFYYILILFTILHIEPANDFIPLPHRNLKCFYEYLF